MTTRRALALFSLAALPACFLMPTPPIHTSSTPSVSEPRHAPLPEGCRVESVDVPPRERVDLGIVEATCEKRVGTERCERALEDEVCRLGGDMVWHVIEIGNDARVQRLRGQAAAAR